MRTIKFRGKRTDKDEWIYGYLADGNCINQDFKGIEASVNGNIHDNPDLLNHFKETRR